MLSPIRLGLVGATGRMGQRVRALLPEFSNLHLQAVLLRPGAGAPAQALAGVLCTEDMAAFVQSLDVVLDFSAPACCARLAPVLAAHKVAYVVASTGIDKAGDAACAAAAAHVPVLQAANLSLGVDVMREIVTAAAQRLGHWDIEIIETHHRHKADGPSGTAYALGAAVAAGAGAREAVLDRHRETGGRSPGTLGYSVVRGGDVAGEHTVVFFGAGERLEITHRCSKADIFARGALNVCAALAHRPAGPYTMADVLPRGL